MADMNLAIEDLAERTLKLNTKLFKEYERIAKNIMNCMAVYNSYAIFTQKARTNVFDKLRFNYLHCICNSNVLNRTIVLIAEILKSMKENERIWNITINNFAQEFNDEINKLSESIQKLCENFTINNCYKLELDQSILVPRSADLFMKTIEKVNWEEIGNKIGDSLADSLTDINWTEIFEPMGDIVWEGISFEINLENVTVESEPIENIAVTTLEGTAYEEIKKIALTAFETKIIDSLPSPIFSVLSTPLKMILLEEITWEIGNDFLGIVTGDKNKAEKIKEIGLLGGIKELSDDLQGLPRTFEGAEYGATALCLAYKEIENGMIYTDNQLEKMQRKWDLSIEEMETLRQAMLDANPELRNLADNISVLWGASVETLEDINYGLNLVKDGTVSASEAFKEFSKPMWGMNQDALEFFKIVQEGSNKLKEVISENVNDSGGSFFGSYDININMNTQIEEELSQVDLEIISWLNGVPAYSSKAIEDFGNGILNGKPKVKMVLSEIVGIAIEEFSNLDTIGIGKNLVYGIESGVSNQIPSLNNKMREAALGIEKTLKSVLQIHSPSKVMTGIGEYTMLGFQDGIENIYEKVLNSVRRFSYNLRFATMPNIASFHKEQNNLISEQVSDELYETNKFNINAETDTLLKELIAAVKENRQVIVEIDGASIFSAVIKENIRAKDTNSLYMKMNR